MRTMRTTDHNVAFPKTSSWFFNVCLWERPLK